MKRIKEDFQYIYFFVDYFKSKLIGRPYLMNEKGFDEKEIEEAKKFIKENGTKFYTADDDDLDKTYGYYYSNTHDIDFEPLDRMEKDSGHTKLYFFYNNQWNAL